MSPLSVCAGGGGEERGKLHKAKFQSQTKGADSHYKGSEGQRARVSAERKASLGSERQQDGTVPRSLLI